LSKEAEAASAVVLHCPVVLLLYSEVMSSDFIEVFLETDLMSYPLKVTSSSFLYYAHKCVEILVLYLVS
jgi:hypothetical protein